MGLAGFDWICLNLEEKGILLLRMSRTGILCIGSFMLDKIPVVSAGLFEF